MRKKRKHREPAVSSFRWLGLYVAFCILAGCSKLVPVEGKVTFEGHGLEGATVVFTPAEGANEDSGPQLASSFTQKDGSFALQTRSQKGAFPGKYKVTVSKRALPPGAKPPEGNLKPRELAGVVSRMVETVPKIYQHEGQTPLQIDVSKKGVKDLHLSLTRQGS